MSTLPVGGALDPLVLDHLDPVSIWIQKERHIVHPTVSQTLLEVDLERFEALAGRLEVVD